MRSTLLLAAALTLAVSACASTSSTSQASASARAAALDAVIAGSWRTPANVARDGFRHPKETLGFFGVDANDTVNELTPGGGW